MRGHIRTWDYVRKQNFVFFDSISEQVDYYLTTWDLPEYSNDDKNKIIKSFEGQNLISAVFVPKDPTYYTTTIFKTSFLTIKILVDKVQQEKTGKYDAVFDTRPDVIVNLKPDQSFPKIDESIVYTVNPGLIETEKGKSLFLEDYFFIMSSEAFNTFTQRHKLHTSHSNAQVAIGEHINKLGYSNGNANWLDIAIVRPSILENNISPNEFFNHKLDVPALNYPTWISYSNEEKISICKKYGIALEDYQTSGSHLIKIS